MAPPIDVVYLSGSSGSPLSSGADRLGAQLHEQGLQIAVSTTIHTQDADPSAVRAVLAAALEGTTEQVGPANRSPLGDQSLSGDQSLPAIALLDSAIVVNAPPLGAVLDDPRVHTGALSVADAGRQLHLGVLRVAGVDRRTAAELARELPADSTDLLLDLTRALTAADLPVRPIGLGGYGWSRPADGNESAITSLDERRVRLREAARGGDGFYSTFVLRRLSWRLTGLAERTGLTPNQVTLISFALGLVAAGCLAAGSRPWSVAGALLLQFCLVVDCVDGELARYRRRFSRFGAWLDATTDRVKEFATIAALGVAAAVGSANGHSPDLWWLVAAAFAVQTFRNLFDLGWATQRSAEAAAVRPAVQPRLDWIAAPAGLRAPGSRPAGPGAASWLRRVGHFPIGERFLLISLGAAFWTPRGTLIALLAVGLLSAGYMVVAFAVRGRSSTASGRRVAGLADTGPVLAAALRRLSGQRAGRLTVVLPALTALIELALIWVLAHSVAGARGSAAVVLIAATAIAHYQQAYGVRDGGADPDPRGPWVIGTDLRLLAVVVVVVLPALVVGGTDGDHWATIAVWLLAGVVTVASTVRSLRSWTGPDRESGQSTSGQVDVTGGGAGGSQSPVLRQAIGGVR